MKIQRSKSPLLFFIVSIALLSCSKNDPDMEAINSEHKNSKLSATVSSFTIATPDGFASGATGGAGGSSITVSTASDFKTAAESSTTQTITVSGNLNLGSSRVSINSNKTIVGASSSSGLIGNLTVSNKTNIIIQNLNITNPSGIGTGDGLEISGSTKVFVTKCTFTDCKDGSLDIVRASDYVTVSWCRFRYINQTVHNFTNLVGNGDDVPTDRGKLHVTMHHNWYEVGVKERQPLVRYGYVHCYNNYYGADFSNYTVGVGNESHILLENNTFENQRLPWRDLRSSTSLAYELKWTSGNVFINSPIPTWATNSATTFSRPYTYTMHTGSAIKTAVVLGAGNM